VETGLYASVSTDNGKSWEKPRRITSVNAPHGWATHAKSYACGPRVHLAWTDAPEGPAGPRAAYYMTSGDGGLTWEKPERLTLASEGESWAAAVAGTDSYAIDLVRRSDALFYRRRSIAASLPAK
jgi:Neuraminidase (sialidase)